MDLCLTPLQIYNRLAPLCIPPHLYILLDHIYKYKMNSTSHEWSWFCGKNYSEFEHRLDNSSWDNDDDDDDEGSSHLLDNGCRLSALDTGIQITFLCLFSILLVILGCCTRYKSISTPYILRYPGHVFRWMISMVLSVVLLAGFAEGLLTSDTNTTHLPYLYVSSIFGLLGVVTSLVFSHHMELWRQPMLSWLLLVYWLSSVTADTCQLLGLARKDMIDVNIVRFDVMVCRLVLDSTLLINELNVIRIKVGIPSKGNHLVNRRYLAPPSRPPANLTMLTAHQL